MSPRLAELPDVAARPFEDHPPLPIPARRPGSSPHESALQTTTGPLVRATTRNNFDGIGANGSALVTEVDLIAHAGEGTSEAGRLTAPMPGKLVAFLAQPGDAVSKGQPLAVMEAMKMEHTIIAPRDGVVAELLFGIGDQVGDGAELLRLQTVG